METWFYLDGGQQRGPLDVEELRRAILAFPDPRGVLVWNQDMADWQPAGTVPELRERLPPPRPSLSSGMVAPERAPVADAEAIARLYRRLVLLVGLEIVLAFFQGPILAAGPKVGLALALVFLVAALSLV